MGVKVTGRKTPEIKGGFFGAPEYCKHCGAKLEWQEKGVYSKFNEETGSYQKVWSEVLICPNAGGWWFKAKYHLSPVWYCSDETGYYTRVWELDLKSEKLKLTGGNWSHFVVKEWREANGY